MTSIDELLEKWNELREKRDSIDKKLEKIKKAVKESMDKKQTDVIIGTNFKVMKRVNTRTYITKELLPSEIWQKYSSRCSYDVLKLVKRKN